MHDDDRSKLLKLASQLDSLRSLLTTLAIQSGRQDTLQLAIEIMDETAAKMRKEAAQ